MWKNLQKITFLLVYRLFSFIKIYLRYVRVYWLCDDRTKALSYFTQQRYIEFGRRKFDIVAKKQCYLILNSAKTTAPTDIHFANELFYGKLSFQPYIVFNILYECYIFNKLSKFICFYGKYRHYSTPDTSLPRVLFWNVLWRNILTKRPQRKHKTPLNKVVRSFCGAHEIGIT